MAEGRLRVNPETHEKQELGRWIELYELEPGLYRLRLVRWLGLPTKQERAAGAVRTVTVGEVDLPRSGLCALAEYVAVHLWTGEESP